MDSFQSTLNKRVVVIGGGLSGLTAAEELLKQLPNIEVTVLQAMNEVGGRTNSLNVNGAKFDLGGTWIGRTQKYVQKLAERSQNQLIPQFHQGTKILDINNKVSNYRSNIPLDVGIPGLLHMQFNMWKIDRMANKLNPEQPRNSQLSFKWDSETIRSWMEKNIYIHKVKLLFQCAVRAVLGAETDQVSFLFFLWYIRQNGGINNLINIQNGLQQKKMSKGAQQLSLFLKKYIQKRNGKIITNSFIKKITKLENQQSTLYKILDQKNKTYQADFIIIAIPPARVNKIQFQPQLSRQRKFICQRNIMGSISKVLFLYDKPYWRNKGFSGETLSDCLKNPIFNAYDDTRYKQNGQMQPAIIVFMNGAVDRQWSQNKTASEKIIVQTLASYFQSEQMLNPLSIHWKTWSEEKSLNGGPIAFYPPGVLSKIDNIRAPQGRIHWAGTQMARQSQGFMDGAIQSGLRVASQIITIIKNNEQIKKPTEIKPSSKWYQKIINSSSKCIQWL